MSNNLLEKNVVNEVIKVTEHIGNQIEQEIVNLDNIEYVREQRLKQMKLKVQQEKQYIELGHGDYTEISERDIFRLLEKSKHIVLHFYKSDSENCKLLDSHLQQICKKHLECKFIKMNVEKCPFLVEKLKVIVIPTLLMIQNGIVIDKLLGFSDLNNTNQFTTDCLESRLIESQILNPRDDLNEMTKDSNAKKNILKIIQKSNVKYSNIRQSQNSDDENEDW